MFIEERHDEILKIINETGRISIGDIQRTFNVGLDSARRDLRILEEKGLLKRTHGGAIPLNQIGCGIPRDMNVKSFADGKNREAVTPDYAAIAKKSVEYIKENDIVYLTSGAIGFVALRYLPKNFPYTLVVNSVALADELKFWDNVTVYVTGGKMRMHSRGTMVDTFAADFVKNMHFDLNLITGGGYNAGFGFSNGSDETANFQRIVIKNSRKNVIMMPSKKIGINAFIKVCDADKFDILVTDWDAVEDELVKIKELGVKVIVAENEETEPEIKIDNDFSGWLSELRLRAETSEAKNFNIQEITGADWANIPPKIHGVLGQVFGEEVDAGKIRNVSKINDGKKPQRYEKSGR